MSNSPQDTKINAVFSDIDIPDSAYQKAEARYKDLGDWLRQEQAKSARFDPYVFPQGSFRFGTVIRPLNGNEDYDLDLACELRSQISRFHHSQQQLKDLVGRDLDAYRKARGVSQPLEAKHRCWRLEYADTLNFHMDTVPCIPEAEDQRKILFEGMVKHGATQQLAESVTHLAVRITDDRHPAYSAVSPDWHQSNPQGYALWFEARAKQSKLLMEKIAMAARVGRIDELPSTRWKTPLQRCVQLLKRHRDVLYKNNPDAKPISIIITTLAAIAYQGETGLDEAMQSILEKMQALVNPTSPRVPNPVNPAEDFADKWKTPEGQRFQLERNFFLWINAAKADFATLSSRSEVGFLKEHAMKKFAARLDPTELQKQLGAGAAPTAFAAKAHTITTQPAKPWRL